MSDKKMNNLFLNNIFTIPCDECYSYNIDSKDNMIIKDYSDYSSLSSIENSFMNNFNFTTILKKNWRNKAKKFLYKSRNKMKKMINNIILKSQN
jgi:hypothetical protein